MIELNKIDNPNNNDGRKYPLFHCALKNYGAVNRYITLILALEKISLQNTAVIRLFEIFAPLTNDKI